MFFVCVCCEEIDVFFVFICVVVTSMGRMSECDI
jgi:hypothetical protein